MATLGFQRCIQKARFVQKLHHSRVIASYSIFHINQRHLSTSQICGKSTRIGCASGFWGDTAVAAPQLVHKGNLDFLVFDYLSEITMSLLIAAKQKRPDLGYAPDFVQVAMAPVIKEIKNKGIRVISNAGGVNPQSCAAALKEVATKIGVDLNIAVVTGDDLMFQKEELLNMGIVDMDAGIPLPKTLHSMNAYAGAGPIVKALELGADIVITGRCVDSALVLAPLMHTFKWSAQDFNKLAAGSLAGHLIECGAQATGGVFTDWHTVPDWHNIGFPIVDCESDGSFILTKPPKTGGLVSVGTVSEQLVYEIGDPCRYLLPDVTCDFSNVQITPIAGQEGEAVQVTGAVGQAPSDQYKVCATYAEGFRATAVAPVGGPRAVDKARRTGEAIIKRCRNIYKQMSLDDFSKVNIQVLGSEQTYGPHAHSEMNPREAVAWFAVQHKQKKALQIFAMEVAPAGTGMAPGLTGIVGGRPRVSPVLKLFSFLYPKEDLALGVHLNGTHMADYTFEIKPSSSETISLDEKTIDSQESLPPRGEYTYRLEDLAFLRSGDKGNNCNIGVVARHPSYVPYLRQALTANSIHDYMAHVFETEADISERVSKYELPGIHGFNFVLHNALGGGGIASLRSDPQGKAFAQMLADFPVSDMPSIDELSR